MMAWFQTWRRRAERSIMVRRVVFPHALNAETLEKGKGKNTHSRHTCVSLVAKHKVHKPATTVWKRKSKKSTTKRDGIT